MIKRISIIVILGLNACSNQPAEFRSSEPEVLRLYECLQTHCIDEAPGAQANAENPEVKSRYFDQCLETSQAAHGSIEHANDVDECMAKLGYYRGASSGTDNAENRN